MAPTRRTLRQRLSATRHRSDTQRGRRELWQRIGNASPGERDDLGAFLRRS